MVALGLWIFVILHAFSMGITNDESYSFYLLKTNYFKALPGTANTHWLNSLFMKLFSLTLGDATGWIRLHSVLSLPFFALGVLRLSSHLKIYGSVLLCCMVLFNPYILDFFSLARGYGLALTFQVWIFVYFIRAIQAGSLDDKNWWFVLIFCALSIASNLSYLYTVLGIAGFLGYQVMVGTHTEHNANNGGGRIILFCFTILVLLTIADLLFIKYYGKDLGYGGESEFILSIFGSVWEGSFYFSSWHNLLVMLIYGSFVMIIGGVTYFYYSMFWKRKTDPAFFIALPLTSILLLNILFHLFFRTPFLFARTAIQWYVPGIFLILLLLNALAIRLKGVTMPVAWGLVSLTAAAHFIRQANIHYCFEWRANSEAGILLHDMSKLHPRNAALWNYGVYVNYYKLVDTSLHFNSISMLDEQKLKNGDKAQLEKILRSDYIIAYLPSTIDLLGKMEIKYEVIKTYPWTGEKMLRLQP